MITRKIVILFIVFFSFLSLFLSCDKDIAPPHRILINLEVSDKTTNSFTISWIKHEIAVSYHLSYRKKGELFYSEEIETTALTYTLIELDANMNYQVRVRAKNGNGDYSDYAVIEAKTLTQSVPTPPTNLKASDIMQSSFKLSWDASTDADGSVIGYYLSYRKKDESSYSKEIVVKALTHTLSGLIAGTTYEVRVRAKDNQNNYSNYAEIEVKTAHLNMPTIRASEITQSSFKLSWDANTDADGNVVGYYLSYRKKGESSYSKEIVVKALTHTLSGLIAGTTYEVRVRAKDNQNNYSNYAEIEVKTHIPPTPPTSLKASDITQSSFKLSWDASTDADGNVVGYYLSYRKKGESNYSEEVEVETLTHTLSGLIAGTTYEVRVRAKDNTGYYSSYSTLEVSTIFDFIFGGDKADAVHLITPTQDNNGYVLVGYTESQGAGKSDMWVFKMDLQGGVIWEKTFGGSQDDIAYGVTEAPDGGFIIVGSTNSEGAGQSDVWVIKINKNGIKLWDKTFGGSKEDGAYAVVPAKDGSGYIITGYFGGKELPGPLSREEVSKQNIREHDAYVIKINNLGEKLWEKTFGGSAWDRARGIVPAKDGSGYVLSGYKGITTGHTFHYDMYTLKINEEGEIVWEKTFGKVGHDEAALGMAATSDGGYILTGDTEIGGWEHHDSNRHKNIPVIKINSVGEKVWEKTFSWDKNEIAYAITPTTDGGYILVGYTTSIGAGERDVLMMKISGTGEYLWTRVCGAKYNDGAFTITATPDGKYIVAGYNTTRINTGNLDAWVFKIDQNGNR